MYFRTLAVAGALAATALATHAQTGAPSAEGTSLQALTLRDARRFAEEANPELKAKRAQLAAAEGVRTDAGALLFNNPQLTYERTRREIPQTGQPGERASEWNGGVSQALEVAGQPRHRRAAADAALTGLRAEIEAMRLRVGAQVAQSFYRVLALQQRVEVETHAVRLFESTAAAVQKRRAAGEDTKLDANVAAVEAERARNQLATVSEQLLDARTELATLVQMPPDRVPAAAGDLDEGATAPALEALLRDLDLQPRLRAVVAREASARARLNLERASRYPDITVGVNVGREGPGVARERLTMLSVTVPLPFFKNNATGIGQAATELETAQIERQATERENRAQVLALWNKLQSLQSRVRRVRESVLPTLEDNQQLSLKSQRAGQIGLLELIVVNRQAIDARRDLIDALAELQSVRNALEAAAGRMPKGE